jgi:hypothetical protein
MSGAKVCVGTAVGGVIGGEQLTQILTADDCFVHVVTQPRERIALYVNELAGAVSRAFYFVH